MASDSVSEYPDSEHDQRLREIDACARMTRWEKFEFWFSPVFWTSSMGVLFLVCALCAAGTVVIVLFHLQIAIHHPDRLKYVWTYLAYLAAPLAISGAVLIYPVSVFRKMARRKKETGSPYPSGEELIAHRYRSEHPAVWSRVAIVLFFSLIAFAVTRSLWASPDRWALTYWIWPDLLWLVAIMVSVEAISPRPGRQWTGFVASSALGLEAILAVIAILRHNKHTATSWGFAFLMALFFVVFAVATIQEGKKKARNAPASQTT